MDYLRDTIDDCREDIAFLVAHTCSADGDEWAYAKAVRRMLNLSTDLDGDDIGVAIKAAVGLLGQLRGFEKYIEVDDADVWDAINDLRANLTKWSDSAKDFQRFGKAL